LNLNSIKDRSNYKITLSIFLPIFVLIISFSLFFIIITNKTEMKTIQNHEWYIVNIQTSTIDYDLKQISSDLMLLANNNDIINVWEQTDSKTSVIIRNIENEFLNTSIYKKLYDQIRLIDKNGLEKARINYNDGEPFIVPPNKLQNKKNRYYFMDTFRMNQGEIFVSPFDLNIEHGEIERPFKPMIRFGTPIYDSKGNKQGIMLLNYLGTHLLNRFSSYIDHSKKSQSMLINNNGYWIYNRETEKSWGFMFEDKQDCSFSNKYPKIWDKIKSEDSNQFITNLGMITFKTIHPLLNGQTSSSGSGNAFEPSISLLDAKEYFWKIVSFIPTDDINANKNKRLLLTVIIVLFLTIILFLGSRKIAVTINHKRQEEEKRKKLIIELNDALDHVKTLRGIVPICSGCKKIRDDKGYWQQVETYISKHTDAQFTHGLCEDCMKKYYPDLSDHIK